MKENGEEEAIKKTSKIRKIKSRIEKIEKRDQVRNKGKKE